MGTPSVGDVVLVKFPFSDLSASKLRPAVIVASVERNDVIVCQITSRPYTSRRAVIIANADFARGSLERESYARPDKLFTASTSIVVRTIGSLSIGKGAEVRAAAGRLFSVEPDLP